MFTRGSGICVLCCFLVIFLFSPKLSKAQEQLCDPSFQDCRQSLWTLIDAETVEIDFAFWYVSDSSYVTKLINKFRSGVKVRILVDPKANPSKTSNSTYLDQLQAAGIPMRFKSTPYDSGGILHMKMMLFAGQNKVQFGTGNYSPYSFVTDQPHINYTLNALYFTDDPAIVNSYKTHFDDLWTDTANYSNYANISATPTRQYPTYPIDPALIFPPGTAGVDFDAFAIRSINVFNQETQKIDAAVYRIDDQRFSDAMISAVNRNVPVRILMEPDEYRNPIKLWDAYNIDRMYAAGAQIKKRVHQGQMHQKSAIAYSQGLAMFGSSNWTENSSNAQAEDDYFTTKPWMFNWFVNQFESKWNAATEYQPFTPLPPDQPANYLPANGATGETTSIKFVWQGGLWAHKYDIYFGTNPNPPLAVSNVTTGSPADGVVETYALSNLAPGATYYWHVVGKTAANLSAGGQTWSFTVANSALPPAPTVESISSSLGTGNGGRAVTINGTNYSPGAMVIIGGALATNVSVVNNSTVTATTPAHSAGVVDVTVINPDGQTGTLPGAYTYTEPSLLNPPSSTSISPNSGATAGGSAVVISGSNFLPGATVNFGGQPATNVRFNSSTSISVTTPANLAGPVDVLVTNYDGATAILSGGYTYTGPSNPAPAPTAVSPNTGPTGGGTPVTITGTNFVSGATVSVGGTAATNVVVSNGTTITITTPPHGTGAADVLVTNPDSQSGSLTGGFTYLASQPPAPTVSTITPNSGGTAGGTAVTISGTNFQPGAVASLGGSATTSVTVVNSTTITAVTPTHSAGAVNVVVTNGDGQGATLTSGFTYVAPAPTVSGTLPNSGPTSGGTSVTISGSGFVTGATVKIGGVLAGNTMVVNSSSITAVTPAHVAGVVGVSVTNLDGQSVTQTSGFTYRPPAPIFTAISPNSGSTTGGTPVTITGNNFLVGATVSFGGTAATNVNIVSATKITAGTPAHSAGAVSVNVTNTDGQAGSLANGYTYLITAPNAPSNLRAVAASSSQINLSWNDNSSNENGFAVEQSTDGVSFSEIARVGVNVTAYSSVNLSINKMYYYRVRAFNMDGNSSYSNVTNTKTRNK